MSTNNSILSSTLVGGIVLFYIPNGDEVLEWWSEGYCGLQISDFRLKIIT